MNVKIVLEQGGRMPQKATVGAAAYDLYCPKDTLIRHGRNVVSLNFRMEMPLGIQAQVEPRSGFSVKGMEGYPIYWEGHRQSTEVVRMDADVILGKIDADYRGICGVIVYSRSKSDFILKEGTRFAQLTFQKVETADFSVVDQLETTDRGEGGFGHSGTK